MKAFPAVPPSWAFREAGPSDRPAAIAASQRSVLQSNYENAPDLRGWAKSHGWRTPWLTFRDAFFEQLLESDERYELALRESGIHLQIPLEEYELTEEQITEMDNDYAAGNFRYVVEDLRSIRRAVEIGVTVRVDGLELKDFQSFYTWAHGRYYRLEDDVNTGWIGDDSDHR